jgi:class 3 adenylate cyclase/tetratricopeptide (TPR) repeat protein
VPARCAACGAPLRPEARFCGGCGARASTETLPVEATPFASYTPRHLADKILKSRSALEGERRQVTVLFADLANFSRLAERLDPEEVHQVISTCFELITAEVHRLEGTINQYTGDGVMALFGAPIAHEDSARRAVHAALGIQRALASYSRRLEAERGIRLAMRIGLNSGPVVVGRIGDDLRMDYTAVGDTTNLAARMQQSARPGTVLVSEATYKAIEGFFEAHDLGLLTLKGHEAARAFEIVRPRGARSRIEAGRERGLTPFVGRERELGFLVDRFREAAGGRGQVVFVAGEAGIGKSRLLFELRRALADLAPDATWLEGQCVSFGQSIPFLPLVDLLRKNFEIDELDGEPEIIAKVARGLGRTGELEAHAPFIRYLLSVDPGTPAIAMMDAISRRRRVFEALRALTLRGAAVRPLVLVVEDLHWMDAGSEEFLGSLVDSMAAVRLLLVMTYRVGYTPPFRTRSFQSTVSLTTLGEHQAIAMARGVLGGAELPPEAATALMNKAEGVPLFIEEVARTLLDIGVLRREGDRVALAKGADAIRVPGTIQDIIMARLDRLGDDGKRAVQIASVIGRQFPVRLLRHVAEPAASLDDLLRELQALEIIYETGGLQDPAYIFKHAAIQDVAYNSLLRERRRAFHQAVGHAIEELYPDRLAEHHEELARHYWEGEDWARAFEHLVRSGDRARDANATAVALERYARALEASRRVPDAIPESRLAEVHQRRCQVLTATQHLDEARAEAQHMLELARKAGDRRLEGEALADLAYTHYMALSWEHIAPLKPYIERASEIAREIGDDRLLARSLFILGSVDQMEAKLREAEGKLGEAVRIARAGGFPGVVVQSQVLLGLQQGWQGDFAAAIAINREAEAAAQAVHDGFNEVFAMSNRAFAHVAHGDYREALELLRDGRALALERDNNFIVGRMTNTLGWLYQEFGDFSRAEELDRESADLGHRIKNGNVEISALINIGFDTFHQGAPERALALFEETLLRAEKAFGAHRWRWSMHLRLGLALALGAVGRDGDAAAQAARGLRQAEETGSLKYAGWFRLVQGELALRRTQPAAAAADLRRALDIARDIGFPTLVWQAAHRLAEAHAACDRLADAAQAAILSAETVERMAAGAPDARCRDTLFAWPRVQAVYQTLERVRHLA